VDPDSNALLQEVPVRDDRQPSPPGTTARPRQRKRISPGRQMEPGENSPELARKREKAFRRRKARLARVPWLDPRVVALYLDRTLVTNQQIADIIGCGVNRVTVMRYGSAPRTLRRYGRPLTRPHPSVLPETVKYVPARGGLSPACELGALRQWLEQRGTHMMNRDTGEMIKVPGSVHGKNRSNTVIRSPRRPVADDADDDTDDYEDD
jgi:hypothetical protein